MASKPSIDEPLNHSPNPRANIGFVCYSPRDFFCYRNLYKHLGNAEFIVELQWHKENGILNAGDSSAKELIDLLKNYKVSWRSRKYLTPQLTDNEFYQKYALLVFTANSSLITAPFTRDKKLVRLVVDYAREHITYGLWNVYFDLILVPGQYSLDRLAVYTNTVAIGNPRFDDWFSGTVGGHAIRALKRKLDGNKETIAYLPAGLPLSSASFLSRAMLEMSDEYNIVLKLPAGPTALSHAAYLGNKRMLIVADNEDLLPILTVADVVISDNSSTLFDAVLADKPVVLVDFLEREFFPYYKEGGISFESYGPIEIIGTVPESIEQAIKRPGKQIGPIIQPTRDPRKYREQLRWEQISSEQVKEAILLALRKEKHFRPARKQLRDSMFGFRDDQAGRRAAMEITKLLTRPKAPKSTMAYIVDQYREDLLQTKREAVKPGAISVDLKIHAGERYLYLRSLPLLERLREIVHDFF